MSEGMFNADQFSVIYFCAKECAHQVSGEESVAWMLSAWDYACRVYLNGPSEDHLRHLGALIEPPKNRDGFRHTTVMVGGSVPLAPRLIDQAIYSLCAAMREDRIAPEEAYREFEEIHPFVDGNGRVGAILFNWLSGTLSAPIMPPNFWAKQPEGIRT